MIINEHTLKHIIQHKNINIIINGTHLDGFNRLINLDRYKYISEKQYSVYNGHFYIDVINFKKEIIHVLKDICVSPNYYGESIQKKVVIVVNFHLLHSIYQQSVKNIIDTSYNNSLFIIHTNNINSIDRNIISRFLVFSLPCKSLTDETLHITYNKIIRLLKDNTLNKTVIETIRGLSYMYYMNHTHSIDLQQMFVSNIGSNLSLPNSIKEQVIKDICRINVLYQHSYRKPIFLEFMIISLFKHLENYTYNL